jgi:4-hydroxy-4-methyl-2-oxoglutarate aldolase
VLPGQYVFADTSGAVVIPDDQVAEVIAGARAVEAEDERSRAEIQQERLPRSSKAGRD